MNYFEKFDHINREISWLNGEKKTPGNTRRIKELTDELENMKKEKGVANDVAKNMFKLD